jgi:hypothetical protein
MLGVTLMVLAGSILTYVIGRCFGSIEPVQAFTSVKGHGLKFTSFNRSSLKSEGVASVPFFFGEDIEIDKHPVKIQCPLTSFDVPQFIFGHRIGKMKISTAALHAVGLRRFAICPVWKRPR